MVYPYRTLLIIAITSLMVLLVCGAFLKQATLRRVESQRHRVMTAGMQQTHTLQRQLDRALSATFAFAALIRQQQPMEQFAALAADLMQSYGSISSVQLAPDGILTQVYPLQGNEQALGHNLLQDPARRTEALATIAARTLTLAGPFSLRQGGVAVAGRIPVFVSTGSEEERFWGFVIVLIRLQDLLTGSHFQQMVDRGYDYELARQQPDSNERLVFAQSSPTPLQQAMTFDIHVPNGQWTLGIAPRPGWYTTLPLQTEVLLLLLCGIPLIALVYVLMRQPEALRREVLVRTRELSEARDQALQAARAKSTFLATMSHEIRTPMNAIVGLADLLEETPLSPLQQGHMERFKTAGEHLLTLLNDVLDFSKIEAGRLELEHTPFALQELLDTIVELLAMRAQAKDLAFLCVIAPDVPTHLCGDAYRLRQILVNLLSNAIKFTTTGSITLRVENEPEAACPGRLRFMVRDTGIGIPPEHLESIFERFTQVDTSTTRRYGGTGLGLSISKRLAELMHGQIWVESSPEHGSTFYVTIQCALHTTPLAPARSLSAAAAHSQPAGPRPVLPALPPAPPALPRALEILLVEDNLDNQRLIQAYFRNTAHHLTLAENGAVALERFQRGHYDVVLMDMQMPVMDGQTATRLIRQWEQEQQRVPTRILALTAHALAEDRQQSLDAGCDGHLTKPIKKAVLLAALADQRMTQHVL